MDVCVSHDDHDDDDDGGSRVARNIADKDSYESCRRP
jgi:hypothetical protein